MPTTNISINASYISHVQINQLATMGGCLQKYLPLISPRKAKNFTLQAKQTSQHALTSAVICIYTMHFGNYIYSLSPTSVFLFGRHILFSVFMPITLETVHICV